MGIKLVEKISSKMVKWLVQDRAPVGLPHSDYQRLIYDIKPCDVILVEGRSRVAEVTKLMTQSRWSHAGLYVGRMHDIPCLESRKIVQKYYNGDPDEPLIIEGFLGKGIIVAPLSIYKDDHLRVCRPKGLSHEDKLNVIKYTVDRLGTEYDVRQILDLARFLFPWSIIPRRMRSSLFRKNVGDTTRQICSSLIAEAFISVRYPILPLVARNKDNDVHLVQRNPKLYTPSDFDYSPYFEVIKYPVFDLSESAIYRHLPWNGAEQRDAKMSPISIDPKFLRNEEQTVRFNKIEIAPSENITLDPDIVLEQENSYQDEPVESASSDHKSNKAESDLEKNSGTISS